MKKTSFMTKLAIVGLMCTVFPSHASADHKIGSYFQAVVLSQEQSPELDVQHWKVFNEKRHGECFFCDDKKTHQQSQNIFHDRKRRNIFSWRNRS